MTINKHEKPSYYSILPASVRYDNRLKANEKILYSELTALANKYGYCNASNAYFSRLYDVSIRSITDWISSLEKLSYIKTQTIKNKETYRVEERRIYIQDIKPVEENFQGDRRKLLPPLEENFYPPIEENFQENNTSNNNTSDNRISSTHIQDVLVMWNALDKNIPEVKALNAGTTRYKNLKARINQYGEESIIKAIDNIANSQFLKGYVNDFTITFDRFVRPNNFPKVLEGNYNDKDINTNNNVSVIRSDTSRKGYADRARAERFAKMMEER